MYSTNSFNPNNSGNVNGDNSNAGPNISPGDNYASPWDIWLRHNTFGSFFGTTNLQPSYLISNGNAEAPSDYNIQVYAHVGIAYFDGYDDGKLYFDTSKTPPPTYPNAPGDISYDMTNNPSLNYPNLYPNNGGNPHEVGNLVRTQVLTSNAYPATNWSYRMESKTQHLPMGQNLKPGTSYFFQFGSNVTTLEKTLLADYGKVFFYEVFVRDKNTNAIVGQYFMHPEIETLTDPTKLDPQWLKVTKGGVQVQGNAPGGLGKRDLYFYKNNTPGTQWSPEKEVGDSCDSREVVFLVPQNLSTVNLPNGVNVLSLGVLQHSRYAWLNSALWLGVF